MYFYNSKKCCHIHNSCYRLTLRFTDALILHQHGMQIKKITYRCDVICLNIEQAVIQMRYM